MKLLLSTIPAIAEALSGSSLIRSLKLSLQLWYFAVTRKLKLSTKDFVLTGRYNNTTITFYLRYGMDIAVLREVFVDKEYDWCPVSNPKVIIDLGAHFGDTTLYYATKFQQATIIAVEPSPENFARLVQHTKHYTNIIPVQAAVGAIDGEVLLHTGPVHFGHSVIQRSENVEQVVVNQVSLKMLFSEHGITKADLIKFDIEGAEFELFKGSAPKDFASAYIGEVHLDFTHEYSKEDFIQFFGEMDSEIVDLPQTNRFILKVW